MPLQEAGGSIDMLEVVNEARDARPRFSAGDSLPGSASSSCRRRSIARFEAAIEEFGYRQPYRGVFPIKVNQLREVVEEIIDAGRPFHFGIEAGSKPELFAALAMHKDPEVSDHLQRLQGRAFIRIALLGRKLGKKVILVVEKLEELEQTIRASRRKLASSR